VPLKYYDEKSDPRGSNRWLKSDTGRVVRGGVGNPA
jgi:hypothetical protein